MLISPANAYIDTLIIPEKQYRAKAYERAFGQSGRLHPLAGKSWLGEYSFRPFDVKTTRFDFLYSRSARKALSWRGREPSVEVVPKGSNISAAWSAQTASLELADLYSTHRCLLIEKCPEALVNGRLQGWKEGDPRGASELSRSNMWQTVAQVLLMLSSSVPEVATYNELKLSSLLVERKIVKADATKEALKGWIPNIMDDFGLKSRSSES